MTRTGSSTIRRLIRNRVTEKDVRDHLGAQGYAGRTAHFEYLELYAIERPGWIQVFTFCVRTRDDQGQTHRLFGVVHDDERTETRIHLARTEEERSQVADAWSDGLIRARRRQPGLAQTVLIALFLALMSLAVAGALVRGS